MALYNPPPPLLTTATPASSSNIVTQQPNPQYSSSSSSTSTSTSTTSSIIIVIIVISSAIIISASIYLLLRFFSRRCNRSVHSVRSNDVVSDHRTDSTQLEARNDNNNNNNNNHVICIDKVDSLPLFTFSSLTGNITGGDCAVCLSKFEPVDQLRLLPLCCHAFHAECIDLWLKSNQTCPLCRSTVNPTDDDVINKILSVSDSTQDDVSNNRNLNNRNNDNNNNNNSFRIEIGSVNRRQTPLNSGRRSYSIGSYEYVLDDGYEVPVESTHRREYSDKDIHLTIPAAPGEGLAAEIGGGDGSGRLNWLRDYVDRVSESFRGSGRFFTGSSRRSEVVTVEEYDGGGGGGGYSRVGEEISEIFRWLSGV